MVKLSELQKCQIPLENFDMVSNLNIYRTRAIISRGLYIFYPISKDHFFVFKEFFLENSVFMYDQYPRAVCNQDQVMMAHIR